MLRTRSKQAYIVDHFHVRHKKELKEGHNLLSIGLVV